MNTPRLDTVPQPHAERLWHEHVSKRIQKHIGTETSLYSRIFSLKKTNMSHSRTEALTNQHLSATQQLYYAWCSNLKRLQTRLHTTLIGSTVCHANYIAGHHQSLLPGASTFPTPIIQSFPTTGTKEQVLYNFPCAGVQPIKDSLVPLGRCTRLCLHLYSLSGSLHLHGRATVWLCFHAAASERCR